MSKTNILTIDIDNITLKETLKKIENFVDDDKQHYIVTPNPEIVLKAQKDSYYRAVLNNADISVPDGTGIILASWVIGNPIYKKITGIDLCWEICKLSSQKEYKIFLLGGKDNSSKIAKTKLELKYKNIKIVGAEDGFENIKNISNEENKNIIDKINESCAQILFVAYGAPFQEKWIYENLGKISKVKVAMGVGGSIDFISGKAIRAPRLLRAIGLEWVWRLIIEPNRIQRILDATITYSINIIKWKIHLLKPFRDNVVMIIINKNNEILLTKEIYDKIGYRFPQGGIEKNEEIKQSIFREIKEETGFTKVKILGMADRTSFHYWPMEWYGIPKWEKRYNQKFCGQKQIIYFLRHTEDEKFDPEENEIIDHKWVKKDEIRQYLTPHKKEILNIILENIDKYLI
ncbi:MAG: WecB/TagA/CpsF family glycosyltransferase [Patescibacteria group bacterium]|nr:WecB/TagA/CpsF family glycosyltransferase [Patescibacteria group bacterium]MDD4304389.1 WecB/TagA/CpsF family glycosyltransferase [Patescibacteria group bacterium]MDD4695412.1 WecB/TagA/CpsF family glycosyltransferase [Patescibacteria group bacterium]